MQCLAGYNIQVFIPLCAAVIPVHKTNSTVLVFCEYAFNQTLASPGSLAGIVIPSAVNVLIIIIQFFAFAKTRTLTTSP
ncbi:hypothetical protein HOY80DRAFT_695559 [Tuber brumale]|nr:hypothetical protein HOY80DRAFT_695559 [Tuber brumale]